MMTTASVLASRFRVTDQLVADTKNKFADLLAQLDKIPSRKS
jgi:hypothetical protein